MRNLKKILALVLALMMVLSVMVFASAKNLEDYTDAADVSEDYAEAVDVLTGMGIYEGDEEGFRPQDPITRAEVAALVYRVLTADVTNANVGLYEDYGYFTDVPEDEWYAGYVNFVANGKHVVGTAEGIYDPDGNITGYQMLTIMLRAIGYGQNEEFEGDSWTIYVAQYAETLGLTDGLDTTLSSQLTREEVAYVIFQAIQVPQVQYVMGSYQPVEVTGDPGDNAVVKITNSLGYQEFGLSYTHGIVVGNQATGETATQIAWTNAGVTYDYDHAWGFNTDTGLDLFGHQVKVWYDYSEGVDTDNLTTYAVADEATLSQVVISDDASLASSGDLYDAVVDAGFSNRTTNAYWSDAYDQIRTTRAASAGEKADTNLYQVVSNSANLTVDVVIKVDAEVAQITELDTTAVNRTLTLGGSSYGNSGEIPMASITEGSTTTLSSTVIAQKIDGTNAANTALPYYDLDAVDQSVTGTVTGWNSTTGEVELSNGTSIEQSPLYDVVVSGVNGNPVGSFSAATYVFTLDNNGKYLGAVLASDSAFLYGTFVDYESAGTSTGTVNYYVTGVTLEGAVVTEQFKTIGGVAINSTNYNGLTVAQKLWSSNTFDGGTHTGYTLTGAGDLNTTLPAGVLEMNYDWTITRANVADGYVTNSSGNTFFTNSTKFIVVSGTGTDTLSVQTFNGISELLGNADSVTLDAFGPAAGDGNIYYTRSSYIYDNVVGQTYHIDTVILGADDLDYVTTSTVYYSDGPVVTGLQTDATLTNGSTATATQYALYLNGVRGMYYITGTAPAADQFYTLTLAGTAPSGDTTVPVYTVSVATSGTTSGTYAYIGATNNLDTAMINSTIRTVTDAVVVDLVEGTTYSDITTLAQLNNAASNTGRTVTVDCVLNAAGHVTVIYVTGITG